MTILGLLGRLRSRRGIRASAMPNRATRRTVDRIARMPRGELQAIAQRLRRLPLHDQEKVLDRLPPWQAAEIRRWLPRGIG